MIENFRLYSAYYDLLYQDKDYRSEAAYVYDHLKRLLPNATDLLELGSGTGNHAQHLTMYGYQINGIERSADMTALADKKQIPGFTANIADITSFYLGRQFDAAFSLFHSLCYLTTNEALVAAFRNVYAHLKPGGLFVFDFWHGPAVLHHLPMPRTKVQQNDLVNVVRDGETTMFIEQNVAEVNYQVLVTDKQNGESITIREKHPMRYFSIPELELLANQTGFRLVKAEEFLTSGKPTLESWNIFIMLEKVGDA